MPASETAGSGGSPPAFSTRWRRCSCRRWVTGCVMNMACSGNRSKTAGSANVRTKDFPRVVAAQPVIRTFALPAVFDRLPEHAIFITQPVTHRRQLHRRHRVEKAGGEPPEPAVYEAGIGFLL